MPLAQAAKGTAAEGGGLFLRSSRPRKASVPRRSKRKKGTRWVPFLLVARRGFPHPLISLGFRRFHALDVPDDVPNSKLVFGAVSDG